MEDNTVLIIAVLAVVASLAAAGFSYYTISNGPIVLGFATSTGTANLTVESSLQINFTTATVNWGSGKVNVGSTFAVLDTTGTVTNGNWTSVSSPLVLANIGNTNVSLNIRTGKTNATFLGGTNPSYKLKVSNKEAGSCGGNSTAFGTFQDVNTTSSGPGGTLMCNQTGFLTAANELYIDINLTVPYDSTLGALGDTITATASAAI